MPTQPPPPRFPSPSFVRRDGGTSEQVRRPNSKLFMMRRRTYKFKVTKFNKVLYKFLLRRIKTLEEGTVVEHIAESGAVENLGSAITTEQAVGLADIGSGTTSPARETLEEGTVVEHIAESGAVENLGSAITTEQAASPAVVLSERTTPARDARKDDLDGWRKVKYLNATTFAGMLGVITASFASAGAAASIGFALVGVLAGILFTATMKHRERRRAAAWQEPSPTGG